MDLLTSQIKERSIHGPGIQQRSVKMIFKWISSNYSDVFAMVRYHRRCMTPKVWDIQVATSTSNASEIYLPETVYLRAFPGLHRNAVKPHQYQQASSQTQAVSLN